MDKGALEASNKNVSEALKAYKKAMDIEQKAKVTYAKAKTDLKSAEDAYVNALEEAKKVVSA